MTAELPTHLSAREALTLLRRIVGHAAPVDNARLLLQKELPSMHIWIDADACPRPARELVVKFALKRQLQVVMVAGQAVAKPAFAIVQLIVVPSGPDAADDYLVEHAEPGELVICSDVPLADRLVKKGVAALDPRGREFDERNMGDRLAARNLFTELRELGQVGGGQAPYAERDKQAFANALDRLLTRLTKG